MVERDFLADFAALSRIGATPSGGVHREAGSQADGAARRWLCEWFDRHGLGTAVDRVGNMYGRTEWLPGAPYVLVGSHLDSQPTAGRFDGAYGVLAAVHAVAAARDAVAEGAVSPMFNLAVVNWFNEEGSRFSPSLMGSGVYTGHLDPEATLEVADQSGVTVREALTEIGFAGSDPMPPAASYAEIHIEQGRILQDSGTTIGIVTGNWAARKYSITVHGAQSHTGATHLADRHDALVGASRLVLAVRELAEAFEPGQLLGSVGRFTVRPNSPVVVPATVTLAVDLRSADPEALDKAHQLFLAEVDTVRAAGEVEVSIDSTSARPSSRYQAAGVALAEVAAHRAGLSSRRMLTMAGHDSVYLKDVVPTVMLFIPSDQGISHNEAEYSEDRDLLDGVRMLTEVVTGLLTSPLSGLAG